MSALPTPESEPEKEQEVSVPTKAVYLFNTAKPGKLFNSRSRGSQAEYGTSGRGIGAQWKLEPRDDGMYRIRNMQNKRYLGTLGSTTAGSTIIQTKILGAGCEWRLEITSEGNYRFLNSQSELYLAIDGKKLVQVLDTAPGTEWTIK